MNSISSDSVLKLFRQDTLLDLRKLAFQLGVDTANSMLKAVIDNLERNGKFAALAEKVVTPCSCWPRLRDEVMTRLFKSGSLTVLGFQTTKEDSNVSGIS